MRATNWDLLGHDAAQSLEPPLVVNILAAVETSSLDMCANHQTT